LVAISRGRVRAVAEKKTLKLKASATYKSSKRGTNGIVGINEGGEGS